MIKQKLFLITLVVLVSCGKDDQLKYIEGHAIFYNTCISCHLAYGDNHTDKSFGMSSISLQRMTAAKISLPRLKRELKDSAYHKTARKGISDDELESIRYYIVHASDPKIN